MEDIFNMSVAQLANASFKCDCGRTHTADIKKVIIDHGAIRQVSNILNPYKAGKILLVADKNTYGVAGKLVDQILSDAGYNVHTFVYNEDEISPNAYFAGRLLMEYDKEMTAICAVGSGVINDLSRFIAYRVNLPYVIVGTAPSMDGYASKISPMVIDNFKANFEGNYPYAIIADTEIMKDAPMIMIQAGFADMLGKLIAIADWNLGVKVNNEFYCEKMAKLMLNALQKCIDNIEGVVNRDEKAVGYILEGLVLAGIVMGMYQKTRPASGSEHFFAHYWDVDAIKRGEKHPLHGNSVAVGTVIASMLYQLAKQDLDFEIDVPTPDEVIEILDSINAVSSPKKLGIKKELLHDSILHAMDGRDRYTILQYLDSKGKLKEYADEITNKFYK